MSGRFSVEAIFSAVDRMSAPIAKMSSRIDRMTRGAARGLDRVDKTFTKIRGSIVSAGTAMAGASVGVAFAAHNILRAGADFEQAITNVGAVSLMTRDQIGELEKRALQLGATTKFSAAEVAAGMELMGRAGFTNAEILQGIEGVLSAAAAEGAELAETAGHISNVLKGMNLATTETVRVADVLTLASARTNSSISSLGESMATASTTATQFRIPLEHAVAAVALLQDVGLDASEAGSAFNTMLTQLAMPTDGIKAKMRAMGVTFQDAKGNMLPLPGVLNNMAKAAQKSGGNMKQAAFFAELVGMRGQKAALKLKDMLLSGKVGELTEALEHAQGSAKKMADIRMDTLLGDWETFTGAVDSVKIGLFNLESGPLRGVVQGWTAWVEANQDLIVSNVQGFLMDLRRELPGAAKNVKMLAREAFGFFQTVRRNLPQILKATEYIGKAVVASYALSTALSITRNGIEVFKLGASAARGFGKAVVWSAGKVGLLNLEVLATNTGLTGMRTALNAGALSSAINGIQSKLGQAGLLGAALAVGLAIGSWLDETFGLSKKLEDLMAELFGLKDAVTGGSHTRGIPEGPRVYADIVRPVATATAGPLAQPGLVNDFMNAPRPLPELVTQGDQVAAAIASESTTTEKVELTIKDESGKAEVTKAPKAGSRTRLKMPASGRKLN